MKNPKKSQNILRIVADTREQLQYVFTHVAGVEVITGTLPTGDYSLAGFNDRVAIERKSLDDLISCLMGKERIRFEKELARGKVLDLFAVVIECTLQDIAHGRYRSKMKPAAAIQSILAFNVRHGTSFIFAGDRAGGEYVVHGLLEKYLAEIEKRSTWRASGTRIMGEQPRPCKR